MTQDPVERDAGPPMPPFRAGDSLGGFPRPGIMSAAVRQISVRPFAAHRAPGRIRAWNQHFSTWLREGRSVFPHTIVEGGRTETPNALTAMLAGKYTGDVVVRIS
ncbi:hypothetical protein ACLIYP_11565 [Streptomyces nanhaiensis]|uniref:hypothetical protein n=1 Tax=Streptomyces nanhaiensis TaxID=679319 RepID=UPI00399C8B93